MKIFKYVKNILNKIKSQQTIENQDFTFIDTQAASSKQENSKIKRCDVINFLIAEFNFKSYLEIGVRDPNDNFSLINVEKKYSVDPGVEFESNPVDFKMTSDEFFQKVNWRFIK